MLTQVALRAPHRAVAAAVSCMIWMGREAGMAGAKEHVICIRQTQCGRGRSADGRTPRENLLQFLS